jgi:plastocyanin
MKTLRLCVGLLVLSTLSIFGGCNREKRPVSPKIVSAVIINCNVRPDPVEVHPGDKIDWEASDGHDYTIEFVDDHNEPTPNPFPVKHGASNPPHPINGHDHCPSDPKQKDAYYCKYSVTSPASGNLPPCRNDPGVHITP